MNRWLTLLTVLSLSVGSASALNASDSDTQRHTDRYLKVLQQRPRPGTALNRLYEIHLESGDFDAWIAELTDTAAVASDAGAGVLLALVHEKRGNADDALRAVEAAVALEPENWYALFALGRVQMSLMDWPAATGSFQKALENTSEEENRIEVLYLLGRAQARGGDADAASQTWRSLAAMRPDDVSVLEQLTDVLLEEEQFEEADKVLQNLRAASTDRPYKAVLYATRRADVLVSLGKFEDAVALYDEAIRSLHPDNWLYHESQTRLEELFRKRNDLDGLLTLYRTWITERPEDLAVTLRLAGILAEEEKADEAEILLQSAMDAAPTRSEPRLELAELLEKQGRFADAIVHWEALCKSFPDNTTFLKRAGMAWALNAEDPEHNEMAVTWFQRIAETDPESASLALFAAESLAEAKLREPAIAMYRTTIERAPEVIDYYEYLGSYLIELNRREQALGVFQEGASDQLRTPENLIRLATTLSFYRFGDEALAAANEAVESEPDSFDLGSERARLLARHDRADEALAELERTFLLAPNEYFRDEITDRKIRTLSRLDLLEEAYNELAERLLPEQAQDAQDIMTAAKMAAALRMREEAADWAERALQIDPESERHLAMAGAVYKRIGDYERQAVILEQLAKIRPEQALTHLSDLTRLHMSIGDLEKARFSAERAMKAAPGAKEGYSLIHGVLIASGELEEAVSILRTAIKRHPADAQLRIRLAGNLQTLNRPADAIDTYWQVYELAEDDAGRLAVVRPLAELYYHSDRFEVLLERFKKMKRADARDAAASLALSECYLTVQDEEAARRELVGLLASQPENKILLKRLASMSLEAGDTDEAIQYQEKLVKLEPSPAHYRQLGNHFLSAGKADQAIHAWEQSLKRRAKGVPADPAEALLWVEKLSQEGFQESALEQTRKLLRSYQDDWRISLRLAIYLYESDELEEAEERILSLLSLPDGDLETVSTNTPTQFSAAYANLPPEVVDFHSLFVFRYANRMEDIIRFLGMHRQLSARGKQSAESVRMAFYAVLEHMGKSAEEIIKIASESSSGASAEARARLKILVLMDEKESALKFAGEFLDENPDDDFMRNCVILGMQDNMFGEPTDESFENLRQHIEYMLANRPQYDEFYTLAYAQALSRAARTNELKSVAMDLATRDLSDDMNTNLQLLHMLIQSGAFDTFRTVLEEVEKKMEEQTGSGHGGWSQHLLAMTSEALLNASQFEEAVDLFKHHIVTTAPTAGSLKSSGRYSRGFSPFDSFPAPNKWWDQNRFRVLQNFYNACAAHEQGELLGKVLEDLSESAESLPARIQALLARSYCAWWEGEEAEALEYLQLAADAVPTDDGLRLALASLQHSRGNTALALTTLAGIRARYGPTHRAVQQMILSLAWEINDRETARKAALRLFTQKLDAAAYYDLAEKLDALGLDAKAELTEKRAEKATQSSPRGRSSQGVHSLYQAMNQANEKKQTERAVRLARQLFRQTGNPQSGGGSSRHLRRNALSTLEEAGMLEELIVETEERLERNPNSTRLMSDLFDLHTAAGNDEKADKIMEQVLASSATNYEFLLKRAESLQEKNEYEESAKIYLSILKQAPEKVVQRSSSWEVTRAITQADRVDEFVATLMEHDFKSVTRRSAVHGQDPEDVLVEFARQLIQNRNEDFADSSLKLTRWLQENLSNSSRQSYRVGQLADIAGRNLMQLDRHEEAFNEYANTFVPEKVARELGLDSQAGKGRGMGSMPTSWSDRGVESGLTRFLDCAAESGNLERLGAACNAAASSGDGDSRYLRALVNCRLGNKSVIREDFDEIVKSARKSNQSGSRAHGSNQVLAQELAKAELYEESIQIHEVIRKNPSRSMGLESYTLKYYVNVLKAAGEKEKVRNILKTPYPNQSMHQGMPQQYLVEQKSRYYLEAAKQLQELGYLGDALLAVRKVTGAKNNQQNSWQLRQAREVEDAIMSAAIDNLKNDESFQTLISESESAFQENPDSLESARELMGLYGSARMTNELDLLVDTIKIPDLLSIDDAGTLVSAFDAASRYDRSVALLERLFEEHQTLSANDHEALKVGNLIQTYGNAGEIDRLIERLKSRTFRKYMKFREENRGEEWARLGDELGIKARAYVLDEESPREAALKVVQALKVEMAPHNDLDDHIDEIIVLEEILLKSLGQDRELVDLLLPNLVHARFVREINPELSALIEPRIELNVDFRYLQLRNGLCDLLDSAQRTGDFAPLLEAVRSDPRDLDDEYLLAMLQIRAGNTDWIRENLKPLLNRIQDPDEKTAVKLGTLAFALNECGMFDEAVQAAVRAVETLGTSDQKYLLQQIVSTMADVLTRDHDKQSGRAVLRSALASVTNQSSTAWAHIQNMDHIGYPLEAVETADKLLDNEYGSVSEGIRRRVEEMKQSISHTSNRTAQAGVCKWVTDPVSVDGVLEEWGELPCSAGSSNQVVVAYNTGEPSDLWKGAEDGSFAFAVSRDQTNLYLAIRVTDQSITNEAAASENAEEIKNGDNLHLYLDVRPPEKLNRWRKSRSNVHVFRIAPGLDGADTRVGNFSGKILVHSTKSTDGFELEAAIPFTELDAEWGVSATRFNLDVGYDDRDAGDKSPRYQLVWSGTEDNAKDTRLWGRFTAEGAPQSVRPESGFSSP